MIITKLTLMTKAAKIPKETMGIMGLMQVAKKDTAVVTEVIIIALVAFLRV